MVHVGLQISANLENVEVLKTCHPDYPFYIKINCANCGEKFYKYHDITESERTHWTMGNPKGFNFYMKCTKCNREISIDIVEKSNGVYTEEDSGSFKTIVVFDCRGAEPVEFSPRRGWILRSLHTGEIFEDIDFLDDDIIYRDENNNYVVVSDFVSRFIKLTYKSKAF